MPTGAGYGTFTQKAVAQEIVAAGYPDLITVTVDTAARDGGTAGGGASTNLKPGTVLCEVTATGQYSDYNYDDSDGTEQEQNCVILMEEIADISTGDQNAVVAVNGVFDYNKLRFATADDKTNFEWEKSNFQLTNPPA